MTWWFKQSGSFGHNSSSEGKLRTKQSKLRHHGHEENIRALLPLGVRILEYVGRFKLLLFYTFIAINYRCSFLILRIKREMDGISQRLWNLG